ncbi:uncharacterized protein FTJAE_6868 [Fusarium tjaetaba]|uniref:Uncharacterized protein n=1 Tax=Fusarium tjaetaba TaxID=1567544 RepID=A0A8H5RIX0_9HYPO|nr:uncharacterized protein FTJAE_6868 [Fusarium tjaetaba]KAF5633974.1 hypothetical protein FTJAE_6868 [Fusarium tjaetaba]
MALAFAIIYILVVGLGILSSYHDGIFNEFVEEVHNMETDDEDWDSDEEDDDDGNDDESDDDGHSSGAIQLEPKIQR